MAMDETAHRDRLTILTTAALRAAVSWTRRIEEPQAWRELSRMTGVVMYVLGPGHDSISPIQLVERLHRPLGELFAGFGGSPLLGELTLLDRDDQLTDAALEVASEYTQALFGETDSARRWLPTWTWQRAEQIERLVFDGLRRTASTEDYSTSRRFLIEHPAGYVRELTKQMNLSGSSRVARYVPIPAERVSRSAGGEWWWPCPTCRWPMRVRSATVECGYSHHQARFRLGLTASRRNGVPGLVKMSKARLRVPEGRPTEGAQCLELAVWRFVTVPGIPELDLERRLLLIDGTAVQMWPDRDRVDLLIRSRNGQQWEVDVKDRYDPMTVIRDAPPAKHIVVPSYRRKQIRTLERAWPEKSIWTIDGFVHEVRRRALDGSS